MTASCPLELQRVIGNSQFSFVFLPLYRVCNAKTFDQAGAQKNWDK